MFKKRAARNIRQKRNSDSENEADDRSDTVSVAGVPLPGLSCSAKPSPPAIVDIVDDEGTAGPKVNSGNNLLSFGDEEEEQGEFRLKKKSQQRRMERLQKKMNRQREQQQQRQQQQNSAEVKSEDHVKSERESSPPHRASSNLRYAPSSVKIEPDSVVADGAGTVLLQMNQENGSGNDQIRFNPGFASNSGGITGTSVIPDARAVYLAKKKRQQAREGRDTIPLDDTKKFTSSKSRLIREEDENEASSGEEGGQFYSRSRLMKEEDQKRREQHENFMEIEEGDSDGGGGGDPEFDQWEQDQISKSLPREAREMMEQANKVKNNHFNSNDDAYNNTTSSYTLYGSLGPPPEEQFGPEPMELEMDIDMGGAGGDGSLRGGGSKGAGGAGKMAGGHDRWSSAANAAADGHSSVNAADGHQQVAGDDIDSASGSQRFGGGHTDAGSIPLPKGTGPVQLNLRDLLDKLNQGMDERVSVVRGKELELEKLDGHLTEAQTSMAGLEELQPRHKIQYELFQDMRAYTRDLLDCLQLKSEQVEGIVQRWLGVLAGRQEFLYKRRRQDVKDEFEQCAARAKPTDMQQEFLKSPNRMLRAAERESRRSRRRVGREKTPVSMKQHEDGESTDEEETPSRLAAFDLQIAELKKESENLMNDVIDELRDLPSVLRRLERWTTGDGESFRDAYIALTLPKLLSPIIQHELLFWNPLKKDSIAISEMSWYQHVIRFGSSTSTSLTSDSAGANAAAGADESANSDAYYEKTKDPELPNLIPLIVDKVILPHATRIIEQCFDPTSRCQTENLVGFLRELQPYPTITAGSLGVQRLLTVLHRKLKTSIDEDLFTPIYSKQLIENEQSGAREFLQRQFWCSNKLLENIMQLWGWFSWDGINELAVDGIINRHIVLALQSFSLTELSTQAKIKAVLSNVKSSWLEERGDRELGPLFNVIWRVGEELVSAGAGDLKNSRSSSSKEGKSQKENGLQLSSIPLPPPSTSSALSSNGLVPGGNGSKPRDVEQELRQLYKLVVKIANQEKAERFYRRVQLKD